MGLRSIDEGCQSEKRLLHILASDCARLDVVDAPLGTPRLYVFEWDLALQIFLVSEQEVLCLRCSPKSHFIPDLLDVFPRSWAG